MQNPPPNRWAAGTRALDSVCDEWKVDSILSTCSNKLYVQGPGLHPSL
jgi:hypothetical protein